LFSSKLQVTLLIQFQGEVHFTKVVDGVVKVISTSDTDGLLGLHGTHQNSVVKPKGINVVLVLFKGTLRCTYRFDALAETVVCNFFDNLLAVILLGVDPAGDLVEVLSGQARGGELLDLHHSLADGCASLLYLGNELGIVEDSTWYLAVATAQTEHKVECRLLLDVVVGQSAADLELLASEY